MKSLPRREFLKMSGGAALAASLPRITPSLPGIAPSLPRIALQLYTVRQEFEKDIPGTLHRLAALGIRHVETAFWPKNVSVKQAAGYIRDAGLSVCSSHTDIPAGDHKA